MTKRLLLVDDSATSRLLFRACLPRQSGFIVEEAEGAADALAKADAFAPDLVVLDYNLPERNGVEIAEDLLSRGLRPRFALVTANTQRSVLQAAEALGFVAVLEKPITREKVADLLRKLGA